MYRISLLLILACVIFVAGAVEILGQPPEGRPGGRGQGGGGQGGPGGGAGGQRGPRPDTPGEAAQPSGEQPAGEQPASEQPAEEPVEPPTVIPPVPANSLIVLADFNIANRIGLSDAQRIEVRRIIEAQRQELAEASLARSNEEQFLEIYKRNEAKLSNVLTDTQRTDLPKMLTEQEILINFRFQAWKDVLQWIADQAGMQLVGTPPPGTFDYVDQEKRSITEVLDLVNRRLITDGYTIMRDGRILQVVNLRNPIDNRFFPSVKPEDLPGRGKFEFISVLFNLERRNVDTVMQRVEPHKGIYTRLVRMGNQLLIIDTADAIRDFQRIINSVENPPAPPRQDPPPRPTPPPPPVWKKYSIENNRPEKVIEVFEKFVPSVKDKMLRLDDSRELHFYVTEPDHNRLAELLKMMEEDAGAGAGQSDRVLISYPIAPYLDAQGAGRLLGGGPGGMRRGGMGADVPPMPPGGGQNRAEQIQAFGREVIAALKKAYPLALISDAPVAEKIVVIASEADHKSIFVFLDSLRPASDNRPEMRIYRYADPNKKMTDTTQQQLQALLPNAMFTLDAEQGQIMVVAPAKDHDELAKAVRELEAATMPAQGKILHPYRLSGSTMNPFMTMLGQLAAQDKLPGYYQLQDTQRNQVLIWATAEQHELIQKMYIEVTGQSVSQGVATPVDAVVIFTPKNIDIDTLTLVLEDIYPTANITQNIQRGQIIIRVRPEQKEPLEMLLKQLDAEEEPDKNPDKRYFKSYSIETGFYAVQANRNLYRPLDFVADLEKLVPKACKISIDVQMQQLVVWGTDEEHAIIDAAIRHIIGPGGEKTYRQFQLRRAQWSSISAVINRMFPVVDPLYDPNTRQFFIEAHPRLLDRIADVLATLDPAEPSEHDAVVRFYKFEKELTWTMIQGLQQLAPTASITPDYPNKQIMVIAKPADQKIIEKNTDMIIATFVTPEKEVRRFQLHRFQASTAAQIIQRKFPEATPVFDWQVQGVIVVEADPVLMPKIAALLELIEPTTPSENDPILMYYAVKTPLTATVLEGFKQLAPKAQIIADWQNQRIVVIAQPADQKTIEKSVDLIAGAFTEAERKVERFVMQRMNAWTILPVIQRMYPAPVTQAQSDNPGRNLVVETTPELLPKIAVLIETLDPKEPTENDAIVKFYVLKNAPTNEIVQGLQQIAPTAQITPDFANRQIMVVAPPTDQEKIEKNVDLIVASFTPPERKVEGFALRRMSAWNIVPVIQRMYPFPAAQAQSDNTGQHLVVDATPEVMPKIIALIEALDPKEPTENDPIVKFYPLKTAPTPEIQQGLKQIAPAAHIVPDLANRQIMVVASPTEQEKIEKNVDMIVASFSESEKKAERFVMRRMNAWNVLPVIQRMYPAPVTLAQSDNPGRNLVVETTPELLPKIAALIETLDPKEPSENDAIVKFYVLKNAPTNEIVQGLQQIAPTAQITPDFANRQLMVVAPPTEQEKIEKNVDLIVATFTEPERAYDRFALRRVEFGAMNQIIQKMYPTAEVSFDNSQQNLIVGASPELLPKIKALIELVDPAEASENAPVVKFYALASEPTDMMLDALRRLVSPTVQIIHDKEGKQIMVIAKPVEQKIIEENTKLILASFTPPEEPVLGIYAVTSEERERLTAFMETAKADLKGATIVPDRTPLHLAGTPVTTPVQSNRVSIWAKPTEHKLIATILKQIQASQADTPNRQLKSFAMSIGDLKTAQEILKISHPDATFVADESGNRLLVWATAEEMKKVTATLDIQGTTDNRDMIVYTVVGVKTETMKKVILDMFQGLKISEETDKRKILVWASPEEHVQIAEMVEKSNKEVDPNSELAEKVQAYPAANINAAMVTELFKQLLPQATVYAGTGNDKIIVRAIARDHKRIDELFKQLREKDETERLVLDVYSFGETDPIMVESFMSNQLRDAESMSQDYLQYQANPTAYQIRMYQSDPYYARQSGIPFAPPTPKTGGYYKVDPQMRSVFVFATAEQQKEIKDAMEQLVAIGNQPGLKLTIQRYSGEDLDVWDVQEILQRIVPGAFLQRIYERVPYTYPDGYPSTRLIVTGDFFAYARESDHEKIAAIMKEMTDKHGAGKREMLTISLPDNSPFSRERIIEAIRRIYPKVEPMPGATANQIIVFEPKHRLEQIQKIIDDICQPLPEGAQTVLRTYPLQYISVESATDWLSAIYPNVSFEPGKLSATATPTAQRPQTPGDNGVQSIIVVATPLEHIEVAKTLSELDKDLPDTHKRVPRTYALDDLPVGAFEPFNVSLGKAFPNAAITPAAQQMSVMVVATEDEHKKVDEFVKAYREDNERKRPYMHVYSTRRLHVWQVTWSLRQIAPDALVFTGSEPEQIVVWGTPKEHKDIEGALAKMESAHATAPNQNWRIHNIGTQKPETAQIILSALQYQFPGALIEKLDTANELFVWANPVDHDSIDKILISTADAFPPQVAKPYFFKHVPLNEGFTILQQAFEGTATLTFRPSTNDLVAYASPDVHVKIAASIAEFDVPRPIETENQAVAHNLSDLRLLPWQLNQVMQQIQIALGNRVQVVQSIVPGQIIVWGKQSDQDKVKTLIAEMLAERPETTAKLRPYELAPGNSAENIAVLIQNIAPTAQPYTGSGPNQVLFLATDSDHLKIKDIIDSLNESGPDITTVTYSLRNIDSYTATLVLQTLRDGQGLAIRTIFEPFSKQLVVLASAEDQITVARTLEGIRMAERSMEVFTLDIVDPITAQTAIARMFVDEPTTEKPTAEIDQNSNVLFVSGTKEQLARVRRMLRDMGENVKEPSDPNAPAVPGSNVRVLHLRGGTAETLKELEKLWQQSQPNQLRIIKESETPPLLSLEDEIRRDGAGAVGHTPAGEPDEPPPVYIKVADDGSLMLLSEDTAALDRLELLINRINSGIIFEDRECTIFSVRNISAMAVYTRLQMILAERLRPQAQMQFAAAARPQLVILPDNFTNTITVRGTRTDRREVGKLIALFDVSGLPGERMVRKPVSVPIVNTNAQRVWAEVMKAYSPTLNSMQLPGGVSPRVLVNDANNTLEIIAPEPLASELRDYALEIDRKALEEPGRKIHVIQPSVKASVIHQAIQQLEQSAYRMQMQQMQQYNMMQPQMWTPVPIQPLPLQQFPGGVRRMGF